MNRFVASLVLPAFLLACGGGSNPFTPDPATPDPTPPDEDNPVTDAGIPTALAGDVGRISFNATAGTMTVTGLTQDGSPVPLTYRRRPGLDRNGYQAYTYQDDPLDRHVTAYAAEANNGSGVRGGIAVSGGPRNRFFGGGFYERDGAYSPGTGQVSYAGNYVGVTNGNGSSEDLAPVPGTTPGQLRPSQAAEVTGRVFLNADFADGAVEGNVINRQIVDGGTALPSLVLINTPIDSEGTFLGSVEYESGEFPGENVVGQTIGSYGGIFGGTNASGVAGIVRLEEFDGPNDVVLGADSEEEYGVFVLDQCGQPVQDTVGCAGTNP